MRQMILLLLAAAILLSTSPSAGSPAAAAAALPAPIGGAAPTLHLEPAHGYAGQPVHVSGTGVAGLPGVRVAWLLDDATYTAAVSSLQADGSYTAELRVPPEAALGAARVCAAPTGTESAAFACAAFTVDAPPPASLDITLPAALLPPADVALGTPGLAALEPMRLSLLDAGGATVASALVSLGGRVQIAEVPPGLYQASVTGAVGKPFDLGLISFDAGAIQSQVAVAPITDRFDPVTGRACDNDAARVSQVQARYAYGSTYAPPVAGPGRTPAANRAQSAARLAQIATFYDPSQPISQPPLGWFISGVQLDNPLQLRVQEQYLRSVIGVSFYVRRADGSTWQLVRNVSRSPDGSFSFSYNVGELPPGTSELAFVPLVQGNGVTPGPIQCAQRVPVNVSPDPTAGGSISGVTTWNPAGYYRFSGTMSGAPGLPSVIADPQYQNGSRNMGDLSSSQNVPMQVSGQIGLDRVVTLNAWQSTPSAQLFGQGTASGQRTMTQPGTTNFGVLDPRNVSFSYGPQTLWKNYKKIKFFEGVVFSYFGIVNVKIGAGIFFGGQVTFSATIYPLQPQFNAQLDAYVTAGGYVSIAADLFGGLVEGGVNIGVGVSLSLPLSISVGQRNEVALRNECVKIYGYLTFYWSAVWGIFGDESDPVRLFDVYAPRGCTPLPILPFARTQALALSGAPRVMPQPAVTAGAGGRMIALAIEDATPTTPSASPQVVARAWDVAAQAWGSPVALSDGARLVDHPTVAFFGDGTRAMAAWAQLDLSAADSAGGMTLAQQMRHMEIYAATYDGTSWGTAQRVTNDLLIDARPSLAGTANGSTLAWVRDTDGDTATRNDSHIAVARWDGGWSPIELLGGGVSQLGTTVPFGRGAATLDGICSADEYQAATHFQFPDAGGGVADLWLRHDQSDLFACVRGVTGSLPQRAYNLRLDPQNARSALAQSSDIQLSVPLDGSAPSAQIGDGAGGYVTSPDILGWAAVSARGANDSAEFRVPLSLIQGGVCDRSFGLNVAHTWVGAVGDDYYWRVGSVWNSPQTWGRAVIECPGENTQPSASAAEVGSLAGGDYNARTGLVWTYDADGDALTAADRRLALASASSPSEEIWRTIAPVGLPAGAQTASVAVGSATGSAPDTLLLSFATPFIDRTGQMVAASDEGEIWTAEVADNDGAWTTASRRLTDAADAPLHGERPQTWVGPDGEALVLFRRFGEGTTTATLGQLALVQARRAGAGAVSSYSPPRYLTGSFAQHWQPAFTVNRQTGELVALSGELPPADSPAAAAQLRPFLTDEPAPASAPAGAGGLTFSRMAAGPDPALKPQLAFSRVHAEVGSTVTITATVENLGRGAVAAPAQIFFYAGKPGDGGNPIGAYEIGPLAFGEAQEFTLALAADGSAAQPVYAEVVAAGDTIKANNIATAELGAMAAPSILSAAPSQLWPSAVEVSLAAAPTDGAAGYRIYRRMGVSGGYELVGETAGARLYDLLVPTGTALCYVARAFDSAGALSPPSAEICVAQQQQVRYLVSLPLVMR